MDFAKAHMAVKGWDSSKGLGKHGQGITDAIKPKLKFDQAGMGHNKAEEFEFQWWDHVFNKAAKTVKVEEGEGGEVKVDFNSSKDELSTKKIRKKAEKAMKAEVKVKLYSNFVRSGTLTGGVMDEQEEGAAGGSFVEDTDLSKLRTLTDDELVKACGGRTAHKGGRHGHKMNAKLARIEQAEAEYMENYRKQQEAKEQVQEVKEHRQEAKEQQQEVDQDAQADVKSKKKKKKRKREIEREVDAEEVEVPVKKKKSKRKAEDNSDVNQEDLENLEPTETKKNKKSKKEKSEPTIEGGECDAVVDQSEEKPRKKKKKKLKRDSL